MIGAARRTELIDALSGEAEAAGGRLIASLRWDMRAPGAARTLADAALASGTIDILVNAAGASRPVAIDSPDAEWEEAMRIGFFAPRELAVALLPGMRARG